ncbi:hypothetical protein KY336_03280 [Candidatus Woesearchaeota archaeon]|nr:hypothetical protein [Candidatus Woesearchaeota archaeon]
MTRLTLIKGEVDCDEFQESLYNSRGNLLSLLTIDAKDVNEYEGFQNCYEFLEFPSLTMGMWRAWMAIACLGQYSFLRKCSMGAIASTNFYCRPPTREESLSDQKHGIDMKGVVIVDGIKHILRGYPRFEKAVFPTRVFPANGGPGDICNYLYEVDSASERGKEIINHGYLFIYAKNGNVAFTCMNDLAEYDSSKLEVMGHVFSIPFNGLTWYSEDQKNYEDINYARFIC